MNAINVNELDSFACLLVCKKDILNSLDKVGFYSDNHNGVVYYSCGDADITGHYNFAVYDAAHHICPLNATPSSGYFCYKIDNCHIYDSKYRMANGRRDLDKLLIEAYKYLILSLDGCVVVGLKHLQLVPRQGEVPFEKYSARYTKPSDISLIVDGEEDDALKIMIKIWKKYEEENPTFSFPYLDKFIDYVYANEFGFSLKKESRNEKDRC